MSPVPVGAVRPGSCPADAAAALLAQIDLLVRLGRQSLAPGAAEAQLREETGAGSGRIGKDTVTSVAGLRSVTRAASGEAFPALLVSVNQEGVRLNAVNWPDVVQLAAAFVHGLQAAGWPRQPSTSRVPPSHPMTIQLICRGIKDIM